MLDAEGQGIFSVRCSCCTASDHLQAVCRKCYVHPAVLETYLDGTMLEALKQETEQELADTLHSLKPEEAAVMALLGWRLAQEVEKQ